MKVTRDRYTYNLTKDGYDLYFDGDIQFTQYEPYIPFRGDDMTISAENHINALLNGDNYAVLPPIEERVSIIDERLAETELDIDYRLSMLELGLE